MKPTPEMIEAVARAICAAAGYDPDSSRDGNRPKNESSDGWKAWFSWKAEARAAIAALAVAPAQGVRVKPLVWRSDFHPHWITDEGYAVLLAGKGAYQARLEGKKIGSFDTLDEAQAAAQADYEARILSALEPALNGVSLPANEVDVARKYPVAPAPVVPEGWRLAPVEPTDEMLDAAENLDWADENVRGMCCNQWHAMLAAAPQPAKEEG